MTDRFTPIDYDIFCGMDVSKKSIEAIFLDWRERWKRINVPHSSKNIVRFAEKHFYGKRIAFVYEAGPTGYGLYDDITQAGYKCLIAAPSMIPTAPGQRVKTNRLDGFKLAINLRAGVDLPSGGLKVIHVPSRAYRDLRYLTHDRDNCARRIRALRCHIKALLLMEGIPFPGERWNSASLKAIKELRASSNVTFLLNRLVERLKYHRQESIVVMRQIRLFFKENPELKQSLKYLLSINGVGAITAAQFLARVGDWHELGSVKQTCGFLGFGPREKSTGDKVRRGEITAVGDRALRAKIIQCSWKAIQTDFELKTTFNSIWKRNPDQYGKQKAIVAVGRKLTARMHTVLKEQRLYHSSIKVLNKMRQIPGTDPMRPQGEGIS